MVETRGIVVVGLVEIRGLIVDGLIEIRSIAADDLANDITVSSYDIVNAALELPHGDHGTSSLLVASLLNSLHESLPVGSLILRWVVGVGESHKIEEHFKQVWYPRDIRWAWCSVREGGQGNEAFKMFFDEIVDLSVTFSNTKK